MDHPLGPPARAIVGIAFGVTFGVAIAFGSILLFLRCLRNGYIARSCGGVRSCALPVQTHGMNVSTCLSESKQPLQPYSAVFSVFSFWGRSMEDTTRLSHSRVSKFTYKELQKATKDFTIVVGKGAFGPVYKASLPNLSVAAVKVLANNSKQGEKEFQNEMVGSLV